MNRFYFFIWQNLGVHACTLCIPISAVFYFSVFICHMLTCYIFSFQDWFDARTERSYNNKTQCMVEQYNKYFQRPLRIDSRSIMIEVSNIFFQPRRNIGGADYAYQISGMSESC